MARAAAQESEAGMETIVEGQTPGSSRWRQVYQDYKRLVLGIVGVGLFLAIWQIIGGIGIVDPMFTSSPAGVVRGFKQVIADGSLWTNLSVSYTEYLIGCTLGSVVGVSLGLLMGWYRPVYGLLNPFISGLYSTPKVALISLIIIWFGIGIWSKVAIIFLSALFPILVNTLTGMLTIDANQLRMARSFLASDRNIFFTIALPSSTPYILAGLRLGWGHGLIGVVVGEMYASTKGIGFLISQAGATFQTDLVFVGVAVCAASGIAVMQLIGMLEKRVESWRPAASSQS